jgi:hypothetical protein
VPSLVASPLIFTLPTCLASPAFSPGSRHTISDMPRQDGSEPGESRQIDMTIPVAPGLRLSSQNRQA